MQGVDLELREGELIVLLGASGGGESTLLDIFGRLDLCSEGVVTYGGADLTAANEDEPTL